MPARRAGRKTTPRTMAPAIQRLPAFAGWGGVLGVLRKASGWVTNHL